MTDTDRTTRTMIVSFAIAIMALIPLRFVEVGQMIESQMSDNVQVLGVRTDGTNGVVLPQTQEEMNLNKEGVLEAPYDKIDGKPVLGVSTEVPSEVDCIVSSDAQAVVDSLKADLARPGLSSKVKVELVNQIRMVEVNTCK